LSSIRSTEEDLKQEFSHEMAMGKIRPTEAKSSSEAIDRPGGETGKVGEKESGVSMDDPLPSEEMSADESLKHVKEPNRGKKCHVGYDGGCENGGSCIEGACTCTRGWTGSDCTKEDETVGDDVPGNNFIPMNSSEIVRIAQKQTETPRDDTTAAEPSDTAVTASSTALTTQGEETNATVSNMKPEVLTAVAAMEEPQRAAVMSTMKPVDREAVLRIMATDPNPKETLRKEEEEEEEEVKERHQEIASVRNQTTTSKQVCHLGYEGGCENGGVCIRGVCVCRSGWTGTECEISDVKEKLEEQEKVKEESHHITPASEVASVIGASEDVNSQNQSEASNTETADDAEDPKLVEARILAARGSLKKNVTDPVVKKCHSGFDGGCENGGTCENGTCVCLMGWQGDSCTEVPYN